MRAIFLLVRECFLKSSLPINFCNWYFFSMGFCPRVIDWMWWFFTWLGRNYWIKILLRAICLAFEIFIYSIQVIKNVWRKLFFEGIWIFYLKVIFDVETSTYDLLVLCLRCHFVLVHWISVCGPLHGCLCCSYLPFPWFSGGFQHKESSLHI